jgi:hypothetical protein
MLTDLHYVMLCINARIIQVPIGENILFASDRALSLTLQFIHQNTQIEHKDPLFQNAAAQENKLFKGVSQNDQSCRSWAVVMPLTHEPHLMMMMISIP